MNIKNEIIYPRVFLFIKFLAKLSNVNARLGYINFINEVKTKYNDNLYHHSQVINLINYTIQYLDYMSKYVDLESYYNLQKEVDIVNADLFYDSANNNLINVFEDNLSNLFESNISTLINSNEDYLLDLESLNSPDLLKILLKNCSINQIKLRNDETNLEKLYLYQIYYLLECVDYDNYLDNDNKFRSLERLLDNLLGEELTNLLLVNCYDINILEHVEDMKNKLEDSLIIVMTNSNGLAYLSEFNVENLYHLAELNIVSLTEYRNYDSYDNKDYLEKVKIRLGDYLDILSPCYLNTTRLKQKGIVSKEYLYQDEPIECLDSKNVDYFINNLKYGKDYDKSYLSLYLGDKKFKDFLKQVVILKEGDILITRNTVNCNVYYLEKLDRLVATNDPNIVVIRNKEQLDVKSIEEYISQSLASKTSNVVDTYYLASYFSTTKGKLNLHTIISTYTRVVKFTNQDLENLELELPSLKSQQVLINLVKRLKIVEKEIYLTNISY